MSISWCTLLTLCAVIGENWQNAQKHVTELDTRRVIFQQSHTNSIQFDINKEIGQEAILNKLCFVSKAGVLTSKFA